VTALRVTLVLTGAALGASIASFTILVVERTRRGERIGGRSRCRCGRQLRWWENVPVVAYLVLRGRARCCGARLPASYLVLELIGAVLAAAVVAVATATR